MLKRTTAVVGTLMLIATIAACGGDEEPQGEDFATEANAICAEATSQIATTNLEEGFEQDEKDVIERIGMFVPIREQALADLEALEPPADQAEAYEQFLASRGDQVEATRAQLDAYEAGDQEQIEKASAELGEAADATEQAAAEVAGLEACAFELPEDDAQAAEDVLREFNTTADPATSCDTEGLVSEPYLEDGFGGVEACTKEQEALTKNPDELPTDVEVSDVRGVDDVAAVLEFEDVGGKFDGEPSSATLYNVDGEWKIYSISTE